MMAVNSFTDESEDEFFEDFSGWTISDAELSEVLAEARRTGDVRLRRIVKQNQYFRWLLNNILEMSEKGTDIEAFLELGRAALKKKKG